MAEQPDTNGGPRTDGTRAADEGVELPELLGEITRVIESGRPIDAEDYLRRYPALAPDLKQFFRTRLLEGGDRETGLAAGAVIDDYRIVREVGRGGMGVVYEAEQISLGRTVALKVLPASLLRGSSAVDRFRREAAAVARLSHPRIVAVHGFSHAGGVAWLAMEFVRGPDLAETLERLRTARTHGRRFVRISGPDLEQDIAVWARGRKLAGTMPADRERGDGIVVDLQNSAHLAAAFALDAAEALAHAHENGIIHRDVKPSNLLLAPDGHLRLSDFGLAKSAADGSLTASGDFVGSPAYVSPEQAAPRRRRIDARADVYSLGVTLYELLTLVQPFAAKDVAQILRRILTVEPPPPTKVNPRIPRDLETIVLKCIEKDPERRYPTAGALAEDLRRFLSYEAISARPPGTVTRVARTLRRHRVRAALIAMGAVIAALGGLLLRDRAGRAERDRIVREVADSLQEQGGHATAVGVLDLLGELGADVSVDERRRSIDAVSEHALALLADGQLDAVGRLLEQLDARAAFGRWSELDRRLLENRIRDIKLGQARALQRLLLAAPDAPASTALRRQHLGALERLLSDEDELVAKNAAVIVAAVGDPTSLGALADALARRRDAVGRRALLAALGALGQEGAVPFVAAASHDTDPAIRMAALDALERLDPPELDALLSHLANDPEPWLVDQFRALRQRLAERPLP